MTGCGAYHWADHWTDNSPHRGAVRQERRLGIVRHRQISLGSLKRQSRDRHVEGGIDGRENGPRRGKRLGQLAPHPRLLRPLAGEQQNDVGHRASAPPNDSDSRRVACSVMRLSTVRTATPMAFLMAVALDLPCEMMLTPRTPRSGAPPALSASSWGSARRIFSGSTPDALTTIR